MRGAAGRCGAGEADDGQLSDALDVSGVWYGRWSGTRGVGPGRFVALLTERDGAVLGQISEPDPFGRAVTIHATITGRRSGSSLTFVKPYDGEVLAHAVDYTGCISDDGTLATGSWCFTVHSGEFIMERERFSQDELAETQEGKMPVPETVTAD